MAVLEGGLFCVDRYIFSFFRDDWFDWMVFCLAFFLLM